MYVPRCLFTTSLPPIATNDYSSNSEVLIFTPTMYRLNLSVAIVDDDVVELEEKFIVRAELVSTDAYGVSISPEQSIVIILNYNSKER